MKELERLVTPISGKRIISIILFLASFGLAQNAWAASISSTLAGGDWSLSTTWVGGVVPTSGDDVIIVAGSSVVVRSPYFYSTPAVCNSLTIDGTLTIGSGSTSDHRLDVLTFIQIDNGGTLNQGGNAVHNIFIAGNFTNNGTFTPTGNAGSLKFTFNGTASQIVSSTSTSISFADMVINLTSGQSLSFGGSITSLSAGAITQTTGDFVSPSALSTSGDLKLYAGNFTAGNSTILGGNFTNAGGTFNAGSGTVTFSGTSQSIGGSTSTTFNNLTLAGSTSTSIDQVTIIGKDLTVNDGTTLTVNNQVTVSGVTNVGNGTSGNLSIASTSGSKTFGGLVTINQGATWSNSANTNVHFEGGLSNAGTFNAGSGIHFFETNSQEINGTVSLSTADISISLVNKGTFTVTSALQGTGGLSQGTNSVVNIGGTNSLVFLDASATGNTVNYTGGTQSVRGINYVNLGLSGNAVKTLSTNTTLISGNLALSNGASATTVISAMIGGNLSIGDGCSFTIDHTDITISGTTTVGAGTSGSLIISSTAGTKTFGGLVTISSGGTWDNSSGSSAHFQNGIQNNGTFTSGSGTYLFEVNNQALSGTISMDYINVASGIALTNSGVLSITTDLTINGSWTQGTNSVLNMGGTGTFSTLDAISYANTINYSGSSQSVKGFNYYNLGLTGTGTVSLLSGISNIAGNFNLSGTVTTGTSNAMTIGGDFIIGDGSIFNINGFDFTVGGKTVVGSGNSGTLNFAYSPGAKTFKGLVTINSGATWDNSTGNSAVAFRNGISNSGTFLSGTGDHTFDTNSQKLTGTFVIPKVIITNIDLSNTNLLTVATSLSGTGTIQQLSSSTLVIGGVSTLPSIIATSPGNSVTYSSVDPTVITGSYNDLIINQSSGIATLRGNTSTQGVLTLSGGNLDVNGYLLTLGSNASISIASPSASSMIITSGGGKVKKGFSAIGSFTFPIGENTATLEYSPITVNITAASGFSSASISASVVNAKNPSNASSTNYLNRYWTLSQTGISGFIADISGSYVSADVVGTESNIQSAILVGNFNQTTNGWKKSSALNANVMTITSAALNSGQTSVVTGIHGIAPTVSITGGGVTVCVATPVQLGAIATGTGTLAYLWSPSTGLSSSIVANPTATVSTQTTYTLKVFDGNGISASDNTTINIALPPAKPTISASGLITATPTLTSSSASGNQWFNGGSAIAGATNQAYQASVSGSYTVQVTTNGCASPMSDAYNLVITGLENPGYAGDLVIFPIPTDKQLNIDWGSFTSQSIVEVRIYDLLGRTILSKCMITSENVIDVSNLAAGQFVFQASQQNQFRTLRFTKK